MIKKRAGNRNNTASAPPEKNTGSESCLFSKVVTHKKHLQETAYVDRLYLKKTLLNSLTLLAYGETLRLGQRKNIKRSLKKSGSMQHSWVLFYITEGEGELFVRDHWEKLQQGDIFLLPPFAGKHIHIAAGAKMKNIYLCIYDTKIMEAMGGALALSAAGIHRFSTDGVQEQIKELFRRIRENILTASPDSKSSQKLSVLFYSLLYLISDNYSSCRKGDEFAYFLQTLSAVPCQYHTMKSLEDALHKDKRTILRLFRKHTGRSPMEYLRDLRLEYAAKLLREGDPYFTMEDIAGICAYKSITAFSCVFKKRFLLTPYQYRKKALESKNSGQ